MVWANSVLYSAFNSNLAWFVFFSATLVYNIDRLASISADYKNSPARTAFIVQNQAGIKWLIILCSGGAGYFIFSFSLRFFLIMLALLWLTGFYFYFFNAGSRFLRFNIPVLKPFILSFVWSFITVVLPAVDSKDAPVGAPVGAPGGGLIWLLFGIRFCHYFVNGFFFDFRDAEGDKSSNKKNLFLRWGRNRFLIITFTVLFISLGLMFYGVSQKILTRFIFADILVTLTYGMIALRFFQNRDILSLKKDPDLYYPVVVDGILFAPVLYSLVTAVFDFM